MDNGMPTAKHGARPFQTAPAEDPLQREAVSGPSSMPLFRPAVPNANDLTDDTGDAAFWQREQSIEFMDFPHQTLLFPAPADHARRSIRPGSECDTPETARRVRRG